ncbi:MAG: sigma-70 family RNA polymerase sigma factor [Gammaproteobacteria bacterium]|nr:sigma-70 family RNA polymerase sigma factor [Gammaproteobacteria bacterium]MDH3766938.1 sigma-70 family RNA polymerase sigma factor [Gammaproteobacteria bacterium]
MPKHFQFEALVRSVLPELHSYALWLSRDPHLAEDLVQESLLRAWRSLHTLREAGAAKSWLMMIIRREHARYYERQRPVPMDIQAVDFPEALLTHRDEDPEIAELRRAIFELAQDYREPLVLQVLLGYSTKEIAEIMDVSQGAVLTRLFRARKQLQKKLATEDEIAQK